MVVVLNERDEPHYSTLEELRESLESEPEAGALVAASAHALEVYGPQTEAVVISGRQEAVYVLILRVTGVETVGALTFVETQ
jgi:hypothetical protein